MEKRGPTVLVVGTGTIGEPLIGLLCDVKERVGIGEVLFHKRSPRLEDRPKITNLIKRGAGLCIDEGKAQGFEELGFRPKLTKLEALARADVVIDCTPKGFGNQNKRDYYQRFEEGTRGFIAQGSEFGFGKPYVYGINDAALEPDDRYIQVLSCNTHNIAVLVNTIALTDRPDNLDLGRFVCLRRANDISQEEDSVPAPTVSRHDDPQFGTHHARDAYHLFRTLGLELNLFSSSMKLNTQYMHAIWFDLLLRRETDLEKIKGQLRANERIAVTYKKSANLVFSFGRDHGHYGRIMNNTVVVLPSLHMRGPREVIGFCFTPQDGNSLLSSVAATLHFLYPEDYQERSEVLRPYFYAEV
jgi:glyceraldehyde-3-phosphate dehydrogenase type II